MAYMKKHLWTKAELTEVMKQWETYSVEEIAETLHVSPTQVFYAAGVLRSAGATLVKKRQRGTLNLLAKEVVKEIQG